MFKQLFDSLSLISDHTELLEVCGWDEERVSELMDAFEIILSNLDMHQEDIIPQIKLKMFNLATASEIDILISMLNKILIQNSAIDSTEN